MPKPSVTNDTEFTPTDELLRRKVWLQGSIAKLQGLLDGIEAELEARLKGIYEQQVHPKL